MSFLLRPILVLSLIVSAGLLPSLASADAYESSVDKHGNISMPSDFQAAWVHLGTWMASSPLPGGSDNDKFAPGKGFHNVYTQPSSLQAYRKNGTWPDGAMLILEVRNVQWNDLPTGHVMMQGYPVMWLVVVKDVKGRFVSNTNWGSGWGWAAFRPSDQKKNLSADYKRDCLGCHEAAKATDLVFSEGYPALVK